MKIYSKQKRKITANENSCKQKEKLYKGQQKNHLNKEKICANRKKLQIKKKIRTREQRENLR